LSNLPKDPGSIACRLHPLLENKEIQPTAARLAGPDLLSDYSGSRAVAKRRTTVGEPKGFLSFWVYDQIKVEIISRYSSSPRSSSPCTLVHQDSFRRHDRLQDRLDHELSVTLNRTKHSTSTSTYTRRHSTGPIPPLCRPRSP